MAFISLLMRIDYNHIKSQIEELLTSYGDLEEEDTDNYDEQNDDDGARSVLIDRRGSSGEDDPHFFKHIVRLFNDHNARDKENAEQDETFVALADVGIDPQCKQQPAQLQEQGGIRHRQRMGFRAQHALTPQLPGFAPPQRVYRNDYST